MRMRRRPREIDAFQMASAPPVRGTGGCGQRAGSPTRRPHPSLVSPTEPISFTIDVDGPRLRRRRYVRDRNVCERCRRGLEVGPREGVPSTSKQNSASSVRLRRAAISHSLCSGTLPSLFIRSGSLRSARPQLDICRADLRRLLGINEGTNQIRENRTPNRACAWSKRVILSRSGQPPPRRGAGRSCAAGAGGRASTPPRGFEQFIIFVRSLAASTRSPSAARAGSSLDVCGCLGDLLSESAAPATNGDRMLHVGLGKADRDRYRRIRRSPSPYCVNNEGRESRERAALRRRRPRGRNGRPRLRRRYDYFRFK
ncbi:hypothetical protein EVAR_63714_1 [Eumeta japonica]|uniref:Uncharacterized protein n=1 Tax=Eumeta variegata TaxID=151549 RepID=A0A4C1ZZD6_EUMVA|nr:hypothetical protein EVAR_63714_1 [Eumeta japonica]